MENNVVISEFDEDYTNPWSFYMKKKIGNVSVHGENYSHSNYVEI